MTLRNTTLAATRARPKSKTKARTPGRVAALTVRTLIVALIPGAALFIPAVQQFLADGLGFEGELGAYDPAGALEPYQTPMGLSLRLGVVALFVVAIALMLAYASTATSRLPEGTRMSILRHVAVIVGLATFASLIVSGPEVNSRTSAHAAEEARGEQTATWVEERYGLTIDAATAENLIQERGSEGAPVLIDGRLLGLTRIAQGGYVLAEDGTATELPTTR